MGWPGKRLNLPLKAVDELGNPTGLVARFSFLSLQQSDEVSSMHYECVVTRNWNFITECLCPDIYIYIYIYSSYHFAIKLFEIEVQNLRLWWYLT